MELARSRYRSAPHVWKANMQSVEYAPHVRAVFTARSVASFRFNAAPTPTRPVSDRHHHLTANVIPVITDRMERVPFAHEIISALKQARRQHCADPMDAQLEKDQHRLETASLAQGFIAQTARAQNVHPAITARARQRFIRAEKAGIAQKDQRALWTARPTARRRMFPPNRLETAFVPKDSFDKMQRNVSCAPSVASAPVISRSQSHAGRVKPLLLLVPRPSVIACATLDLQDRRHARHAAK
jgi:hypothetical protein